MLHVYVGWDTREVEAYQVCEHSIIRRSSEPVQVYKLMDRSLRFLKLYKRQAELKGNQWYDKLDGQPFSTEFSFTRFLVPELARRDGITTGHVLFCDCDFLFLDDVAKLFEEADKDKAVSVVKHQFTPRTEVKMDKIKQEPYPCKLWSSMMLFNLDHPKTQKLTAREVNEKPGRWLHTLAWAGDDVGSIPERWNWIPSYSPTIKDQTQLPVKLGAVHFTEGGPWFEDAKPTQFWDEWIKEAKHYESTCSGVLNR